VCIIIVKIPRENMKTPEYILKVLRKFASLDQSDKSQDDVLNALTPQEKLSNYVKWRLGHTNLARLFFEWAKDCGLTVKDQSRETEVLVILFKRYKAIVEANPDAFNGLQEKCQYNNLIGLCNEAIERGYNYPSDKMNRWLGFTQGVLATLNLIDVDEERNFTRPLLHSIHGYVPPSYP